MNYADSSIILSLDLRKKGVELLAEFASTVLLILQGHEARIHLPNRVLRFEVVGIQNGISHPIPPSSWGKGANSMATATLPWAIGGEELENPIGVTERMLNSF